MNKTVILFAGQGSQYKNMSLDFLKDNKDAIELFDIAQNNLDFNIKEILKSDLINETKYTQPLTFLTSAIIYSQVKKAVKPDALLGFSLGEFTAFYEAGIFSFTDTLNIINKRSELMSVAAISKPGSMQAIIGLNSKTIKKLCVKYSKENFEVSIANYNEPNQTVISGNSKAVTRVANKCLKLGARRAIKLNVSGAFHTTYMKDAGNELAEYIKNNIVIEKPKYSVWLNTSGKRLEDESISEVAKMQIQRPVYFKQAINNLIEKGFNRFIEIGPGKVLSGLVKKINRKVEVINITKFEDLEKLKELN